MRSAQGRILCAVLILLLFPCAVLAADNLPRIATVYDVHNMNLSTCSSCNAYSSFYLVSYGSSNSSSMVTLHDGAAGLFVRDTANCGTNYDDGGSILQDSQGACFDRQNLNGDLRQWGLTQNSLFDVIAHPTGASDAAPIIIKAFAALGGTGIKTLHTHGVSLKIGSLVWIPSGSALTCDTPPVANADRANYSGLPGMLVISHGSQNSIYIDAYDNADPLGAKTQEDTEIYNCAAIIPEWYINANVLSGFSGQPISHPFASHRELENYRVNMALAADFAIKAGPGTKLHDLSIIGFDNCIFIYKAARFLGKNIKGDCNIGVYV